MLKKIDRETAEALWLIGAEFWVERHCWRRWCDNDPACHLFTTSGFNQGEPYVIANPSTYGRDCGHHPGRECVFPEEFTDCAVGERER